jgi:hypothetical protein
VVQSNHMKKIVVGFSLEELETLLALADNQLFRMKFIDSKLPGHTGRPEELKNAQALVQRLKDVFKDAKGFKNTEQGHLKDHQLTLKRGA